MQKGLQARGVITVFEVGIWAIYCAVAGLRTSHLSVLSGKPVMSPSLIHASIKFSVTHCRPKRRVELQDCASEVRRERSRMKLSKLRVRFCAAQACLSLHIAPNFTADPLPSRELPELSGAGLNNMPKERG